MSSNPKTTVRGSMPEHMPTRTLFGSTMDAMSKRMNNIDYADFASGKWNRDDGDSSQRHAAYKFNGLRSFILFSFKDLFILFVGLFGIDIDELTNLKNSVESRRRNVRDASDEIARMREDALHFNLHSPRLALKTNQHQIQEYNNSRRTRAQSNYDLGIRTYHKEPSDNIHGYLLNGNLMDICHPRNKWFTSEAKQPKTHPSVDVYKSANGTRITRIHADDKTYEEIIDYPSKNVIHMPGKYHEHYRQSLETFEVPENIRHKFGSKQTEKLLEDRVKVHDTLSQLHNKGINKKHDKVVKSANIGEEEEQQQKLKKKSSIMEYYDLSNFLRHSVSHGYPVVVEKSSKEEVHNADVSRQYLSDLKNIESPHRRRKDWLGKLLFYYYNTNVSTLSFLVYSLLTALLTSKKVRYKYIESLQEKKKTILLFYSPFFLQINLR